jgi:hypothetical protein
MEKPPFQLQRKLYTYPDALHKHFPGELDRFSWKNPGFFT